MEVTDDALRAYVGPRADYYLRAWHPLQTRETSLGGVNKSAFFGGLGWLFYRKIYRPVVIGTFGNVWYYRLAVRRIQSAPNGTASEMLARLGGTSWLSILGGVGLLVFVFVVLAGIISS